MNCAVGYRFTKELQKRAKYYQIEYDRWSAECYRIFVDSTVNMNTDYRKRAIKSGISTTFSVEPDVAIRFADVAHYTKELATIEKKDGEIKKAFSYFMRSLFYETLSTSRKVLDASQKMRDALKEAISLETLKKSIEIARGVNSVANASLGIVAQEMKKRKISTQGINTARNITKQMGAVTIKQMDNVYIRYLEAADLSPLKEGTRRKTSRLHKRAALKTLKRLAKKCIKVAQDWKELSDCPEAMEIIEMAKDIRSDDSTRIGPFAYAVAKLLEVEINAVDKDEIIRERQEGIAEKLELLKSLLDKKLISKEEYRKRRSKILDKEL